MLKLLSYKNLDVDLLTCLQPSIVQPVYTDIKESKAFVIWCCWIFHCKSYNIKESKAFVIWCCWIFHCKSYNRKGFCNDKILLKPWLYQIVDNGWLRQTLSDFEHKVLRWANKKLQGFFWTILTTDIGSCSQWQKVCFFPNFRGKIPNSRSKKKITFLWGLNCTVLQPIVFFAFQM